MALDWFKRKREEQLDSDPMPSQANAVDENQSAQAVDPMELLALPILNEDKEQQGTFSWTVNDAFEGTQIFGETGSGKTTGSGARIARAFLEKGFGGLVLTAKTTDAYEW